MSWPVDIGLSDMTAIYAVANTPPYLFKHLRRLSQVEKLAKTLAPSALADECRSILERPDRTPSDIARAYALLTAMTFYEYGTWRAVLDELDLSVLDWGEPFRSLMKARAVPTTVIEIRPHSPGVTTVSVPGFTEINATGQPRISKVVEP